MHHTPGELAAAEQRHATVKDRFERLVATYQAAPGCPDCTEALDVASLGESMYWAIVAHGGHADGECVLRQLRLLTDTLAYAAVQASKAASDA